MTDYVSKYVLRFQDLASRGFLRAAGAARSLTANIGRIGVAASALGGATIAATTAMNRMTAEQARLADSVGVSQSQLSGLATIASKIGLEYDNVVDLAEEMNNKIGEMRNLGEMTSLEEGLQGIGLTFQEIKDLEPEAQFEAILDAATRLGDVQIASSSLDMIFGGEASKMTGLLISELDRLGMSYSEYIADQKMLNNLTEDGIQGAVSYSDSFARLQRYLTTLAQEGFGQLGAVLAPVIDRLVAFLSANKEIIAANLGSFMTSLGDSLTQIDFVSVATSAQNFVNSLVSFSGKIVGFVVMLGGLGNVVKGFVGLFVAGKVAGFVSALAPLVSILSGPITLAITGVIAAGIALYRNWDKVVAAATRLWQALQQAWESIQTGFTNAMNAVGAVVQSVWNGIQSIIAAGVNFIIDKINYVISQYNKVAASGVGEFIGLEQAELLQRVEVASAAQAAAGNGDGTLDINISGQVDGASISANTTGTGIADTGGSNLPVSP